MRKPELLILDEATSSMDSESERLIQESINEVARGTALLIVAHRPSTVARADQVYVLREGRIAEEGTYAAPSKEPGVLLAEMIAAQQLRAPEPESWT